MDRFADDSFDGSDRPICSDGGDKEDVQICRQIRCVEGPCVSSLTMTEAALLCLRTHGMGLFLNVNSTDGSLGPEKAGPLTKELTVSSWETGLRSLLFERVKGFKGPICKGCGAEQWILS